MPVYPSEEKVTKKLRIKTFVYKEKRKRCWQFKTLNLFSKMFKLIPSKTFHFKPNSHLSSLSYVTGSFWTFSPSSLFNFLFYTSSAISIYIVLLSIFTSIFVSFFPLSLSLSLSHSLLFIASKNPFSTIIIAMMITMVVTITRKTMILIK